MNETAAAVRRLEFMFLANRIAEAALSYLPEGDPMEYAAAVGWQGLSSTISLGPPLREQKSKRRL